MYRYVHGPFIQLQDESVFLPVQRRVRFDLFWLGFFSVWFGHVNWMQHTLMHSSLREGRLKETNFILTFILGNILWEYEQDSSC